MKKRNSNQLTHKTSHLRDSALKLMLLLAKELFFLPTHLIT